MPEPTPAPTPPAEPPSQPDTGERELVPKTQAEDARREAMQARNRVRELEAEQADLARRAQAAEDRDKTELEKATARAERLEKRIAQMEHQQARHEVAAAKSLPVELLEPVAAGDRPALEQHADAIVKHAEQIAGRAVEAALAAAEAERRGPRRAADLVARGTPVTEPLDMNDFIRAGFRR